MNRIIILSILLSVNVSLFGMDAEAYGREDAGCARLDKLAYSVATCFVRTDFLTLAQANSTWLLQHKLDAKDHIEDLDKYCADHRGWMNEIDVSIYCTPLHKAVKERNVEMVRMLCDAGADPHKKIKSAKELNQNELTSEQYNNCVGGITVKNKDLKERVAKFKKDWHVGCTAIELAMLVPIPPSESSDKMQTIVNILKKQNERNAFARQQEKKVQ